MKTILDDFAEIYDRVSFLDQQPDYETVRFYAGLIPREQKRKILDLGCAEGKLAVTLAQDGHEVVAADISGGFLNKTRELASSQGVVLRVVQCDIQAGTQPFAGEKFQVIYFLDTLEHLINPLPALSNIRSLLTEDGVLLLGTPNACTLERFLAALFRRKHRQPDDLHLVSYDYRCLRQTLNFIGLKEVEFIPNYIMIPSFGRPLKLSAAWFPYLSETLLIRSIKSEPQDIQLLLDQWKK